MSFDFSDQEIRYMVLGNHQPEEIWVHAHGGITDLMRLHEIRCHKCHHAWPCPTIRELRTWYRSQKKDADPVVVAHL